MKARFFCKACRRTVKAKVESRGMTGSIYAHCREGHPLDESDLAPPRFQFIRKAIKGILRGVERWRDLRQAKRKVKRMAKEAKRLRKEAKRLRKEANRQAKKADTSKKEAPKSKPKAAAKPKAKTSGEISVTLKKSGIGKAKDQKATIKGLGFKRLNQTVTLKDTPSVRGMINKISHLVEVQ